MDYLKWLVQDIQMNDIVRYIPLFLFVVMYLNAFTYLFRCIHIIVYNLVLISLCLCIAFNMDNKIFNIDVSIQIVSI